MKKTNKIIIAVVVILLLLVVGGVVIKNTTSNETETIQLASVTNANIGDYIDLGNNIVGTEDTTDDWRILYVEEGKVYAILADYLPNSTGYAKTAGLNINDSKTGTSREYSVYSNTSKDTLLNGINTSSNWTGLANGISGVTVTGSPTAELLIKSYNIKNATNLVYTDNPTLDSSTIDYDLYVPHQDKIDNCSGYWLASSGEDWNSRLVKRVNYDGYVGNMGCGNDDTGIRPIISLSTDIKVVKGDGIWTVKD